jgi:chromosome segregation ATPase
LDTFLKGEDVEGTALDTLKEIQRWIKDDETGTTDLIRRVNGINATLQKEIENHRKDISSLTEQSTKADAEIIDRLDTEINNREIALDDVRNTFKEADDEITENINKVSDRVELLEREVVLISCGNSKF